MLVALPATTPARRLGLPFAAFSFFLSFFSFSPNSRPLVHRRIHRSSACAQSAPICCHPRRWRPPPRSGTWSPCGRTSAAGPGTPSPATTSRPALRPAVSSPRPRPPPAAAWQRAGGQGGGGGRGGGAGPRHQLCAGCWSIPGVRQPGWYWYCQHPRGYTRAGMVPRASPDS